MTTPATTIIGFEALNGQELNFLLEVPVLITFLIAGADNRIEEVECEWAQKLIEFRSQKSQSHLLDYYGKVERHWDDNFYKYEQKVESLHDLETRNHFFANELKQLNTILPKVTPDLSASLYESYKSFARQIAEASGGILGFGAVSTDEHKWVSLPMVANPAHQ